MKKFITILLIILTYMAILPSGNLIGIPVKLMVTVVLIFPFLIQSKLKIPQIIFAIIFILIGMIVVWLPISLINNYADGALGFIKSYLSFIIIVILVVLALKNNLIEGKKVWKAIEVSSCILIGSKIILELLLILGIVNWNNCQNVLNNVFDADYMNLVINLGNISVYRLSFTNDSVPMLWYSLMLINNKKNTWNKLLVILAMCLYSIISFSRVIIFQFAIITVIAIIFNLFKKNNKLLKIIVLFMAIFIGISWWNSHPQNSFVSGMNTIFDERLEGNNAEASDNIRNEQFHYFIDGIKQHPVLGYGMGAYLRNYIRSASNKYSYELEYLSFIYQFGILGFIFIFINLIIIFFKMIIDISGIRKNRSMFLRYGTYMVIINYIFWFLSPIYNPGFLSSNSGILIAWMLIISFLLSTNSDIKNEKQCIKENNL